MLTRDFLRLTGSSLIAHRMRSFLTTLGIAVGIAAVMLLTSLISSQQVLSIVVAPLALVLMTIVQASLYPMYRSVFVDAARSEAP